MVGVLARQSAEAAQAMQSLKSRLVARQEERDSFNQLLARSAEIESAYAAWEEAREGLQRWEEIAEVSGRARNNVRDHLMKSMLPGQHCSRNSRDYEPAGRARKSQSQAEQIQNELGIASGNAKDAEHKLARRQRLQDDLQFALKGQADARAENPRLKAEMDDLKGGSISLTLQKALSAPFVDSLSTRRIASC